MAKGELTRLVSSRSAENEDSLARDSRLVERLPNNEIISYQLTSDYERHACDCQNVVGLRSCRDAAIENYIFPSPVFILDVWYRCTAVVFQASTDV